MWLDPVLSKKNKLADLSWETSLHGDISSGVGQFSESISHLVGVSSGMSDDNALKLRQETFSFINDEPKSGLVLFSTLECSSQGGAVSLDNGFGVVADGKQLDSH